MSEPKHTPRRLHCPGLQQLRGFAGGIADNSPRQHQQGRKATGRPCRYRQSGEGDAMMLFDRLDKVVKKLFWPFMGLVALYFGAHCVWAVVR